MTSISVIGYGSYYYTIYFRILTIILLCVIMASIGDQTSIIMENISAKSSFMTKSYSVISNVEHIVLLGHITNSNMANFFEEYFNEDHEGGPRHCVIMVN